MAAMNDILVRIQAAIDRPGEILQSALLDLLADARNEITFLRSHAGAISQGPSFNEIAEKTGRRLTLDGA